jgi:hypothetical protein
MRDSSRASPLGEWDAAPYSHSNSGSARAVWSRRSRDRRCTRSCKSSHRQPRAAGLYRSTHSWGGVRASRNNSSAMMRPALPGQWPRHPPEKRLWGVLSNLLRQNRTMLSIRFRTLAPRIVQCPIDRETVDVIFNSSEVSLCNLARRHRKAPFPEIAG